MFTFLFLISIIIGVFLLLSFLKSVSRIFIPAEDTRESFSQNEYTHDKPSKHEKVFGRNEGQYIQYEELKD